MNQGDLLAVLKESRPSMPLVLQLSFAWQVADGMDYLASELQCVHRDLAARNVMVHKTEDGDMLAKIADFGLSRHLYSEMYKHSGAKPRPLPAKWMALESLMYFIFTTKSDVWSFGVLLWEVMTLGRTPYPGVENRELLEQIEEHGLKLSKPKGCPQLIYDIILDCTYHEPDERPTFGNLRDKLVILYEDAKSGKLQKTQDGSDEDLSKVKPEPTPNTADETSPTATDDTPPTETPPTQTTPIEPTTLEETPNEISTETPVTKPDENIQEIPSDLNKELEIPSQKKSPDLIPTINLEEIEVGVAEGDDVVGVTDESDDVMGVVKSDKSDDVMGVVKSRMSVKEFSEIGHIYYVIDEDKMGVAPIPPASHIMSETDTPTTNGDVPLA
jgi:serine/threonine protein kinase